MLPHRRAGPVRHAARMSAWTRPDRPRRRRGRGARRGVRCRGGARPADRRARGARRRREPRRPSRPGAGRREGVGERAPRARRGGVVRPGARRRRGPGGAGAPVVAPSPEAPAVVHEHAGVPVTLWTFVPDTATRCPTPPGSGRCSPTCTRRCARAPSTCRCSRRCSRTSRGSLTAPSAPGTPRPRDVDALRAAFARLTAGLPTEPGQPLHGDAHPATSRGPVWCDFEDTCRGPVASDLASLRRTPRLDGAAALRAYARASGTARPTTRRSRRARPPRPAHDRLVLPSSRRAHPGARAPCGGPAVGSARSRRGRARARLDGTEVVVRLATHVALRSRVRTAAFGTAPARPLTSGRRRR